MWSIFEQRGKNYTEIMVGCVRTAIFWREHKKLGDTEKASAIMQITAETAETHFSAVFFYFLRAIHTLQV
jgi:hypothetical protein